MTFLNKIEPDPERLGTENFYGSQFDYFTHGFAIGLAVAISVLCLSYIKNSSVCVDDFFKTCPPEELVKERVI
jgi:hypothetical protein